MGSHAEAFQAGLAATRYDLGEHGASAGADDLRAWQAMLRPPASPSSWPPRTGDTASCSQSVSGAHTTGTARAAGAVPLGPFRRSMCIKSRPRGSPAGPQGAG